MTKAVFIFTCCLALATAAFADQDQQHKKKKGEGQGQGQVQGQGQGRKFNGQGQGQRFKGQGQGQGQKFKGQGQGQGQKFKRQGQGQGQGQKFKGQGQAQGQKFKGQGQKFKGQGQAQNQKFKGQKFQTKHFNFANKVNTKVPHVTFSKSYHIKGSQNWRGSKYVVFRNYRPIWHDRGWWVGHHNHLVFVFGGWYYWNAGYWYPAWGYDPGAVYYFDGPIYASSPAEDPGQVVANVQSALQQEGYYQGDIDGILGPQTRAALADYQSAQGIEPTGAIDEPTLDSLGMS